MTAIYCTGDILLQLGKVSRAEGCYRRVLEQRPDDLFAHEQLGRLLGTFGRRWESIPHLFELVRRGQFTVEYLLLLGDANSALAPPEDIERYRTRAPDDPLPLIALARKAMERTADPLEAESLAREALARDANQIEAWALLGRALVEQDSAELDEWRAGLPPDAEIHPDIWLVRGLLSQKRQQPRAAVRCFWEAARRAPNHRVAHYQLGRALVEIGKSEEATPFFHRAKRLRDLEVALDLIYLSPFHQEQKAPDENTLRFIREAADLTDELGRPWEAWGWSRLAIATSHDLGWAQARLAELTPQLHANVPQTLSDVSPAHLADYSDHPLPDWEQSRRIPSGSAPVRPATDFEDVTSQSGIGGERWTSSCLLADINGDALPDIYDVNYLAGRRPFEHFCIDEEFQEFRSCPPTKFEAEQDRLYVNRGDGTFEDVTAVAGIEAPDGKGLGIVAANYDGVGGLDLFVSNDTTANFFFVNETAAAGKGPFFSEQAVLSGCAHDAQGQGQACMGIAADDADGNGLLDLYVTNFLSEYNTLYLMQSSGFFLDASSQSGLKEPSLRVLGFGTQFLDADLDGWPDLVVTNGHVDDFTGEGVPDPKGKSLPFRMRPQLYRNSGNGHFEEIPAEGLGAYFQKEQLGRGLARLDWDRDGREGFAVSHLDTPAALVTNRTPGAGHYLAIRLQGRSQAGTRSERRCALPRGEET